MVCSAHPTQFIFTYTNHKWKGTCDEQEEAFSAIFVIEFDGPFTGVQYGAGDGKETVTSCAGFVYELDERAGV